MKHLWHHVFHSTRDEEIIAIGGPGRTYRCMKCSYEYHSYSG